jgi:hypothetical protein
MIMFMRSGMTNMAHSLDAGLRLFFVRASLARASDARRWTDDGKYGDSGNLH